MLKVLVSLRGGSLHYAWNFPGAVEELTEAALRLPLERLCRAEVKIPLEEGLGELEALVGASQGELLALGGAVVARLMVESPESVFFAAPE